MDANRKTLEKMLAEMTFFSWRAAADWHDDFGDPAMANRLRLMVALAEEVGEIIRSRSARRLRKETPLADGTMLITRSGSKVMDVFAYAKHRRITHVRIERKRIPPLPKPFFCDAIDPAYLERKCLEIAQSITQAKECQR